MNIIDILGDDENEWDFALFTSYTFSLSFFESTITHALKEKKCNEIWVYVDVFGYQQALVEKWSSQLGRVYRLIPVSVEKGVFHPKIALLINKEKCRLVVSSANLTYAGVTQNLEVIDVVDSDEAPEVFVELIDILQEICDRDDVSLTDKRGINSAIKLIRSIVKNTSTRSQTIHLVSPNKTAAFEQIKKIYPKKAGTVTVLSPFHDAEARVAAMLCNFYKPTILQIASINGVSSFNFNKTKIANVRSVKPKLPKDNYQDLHAKIIEFANKKEVAVLTGSINATYKSLMTTNNVEMGIFRIQKQSSFNWVTEKKPEFVSIADRNEPSVVRPRILYAKAATDGRVQGQLFGYTSNNKITERFDFVVDGKIKASRQIQINEKGIFTTDISEFPAIINSHRSVNIEVIINREKYEGWLELELILSAVKESGLPINQILSLMGGSQNMADDLAIMAELNKWLVNQNALPNIRVIQKTKQVDDTSNLLTPIENIQILLEPRAANGDANYDLLTNSPVIAKWLYPVLMAATKVEEEIDDDFDEDSVGKNRRNVSSVSQFQNDKFQKKKDDLIEKVNLTIRDMLVNQNKIKKGQLFEIWMLMNAFHYCRKGSQNDVDALIKFIDEWLGQVEINARDMMPLSMDSIFGRQYLCAKLCSIAYNYKKDRNSRLVELARKRLSIAYGEQIFSNSIPNLITLDFNFKSFIEPYTNISLEESWERIRSADDITVLVKALWDVFQSDAKELPDNIIKFLGNKAKDVQFRFESRRRRAGIIYVNPEINMCGVCFMNFGVEERADLLSLGYALCTNKHICLAK